MKKKEKGFSLIELLFAGALFTVFAWGIIEVLLTGLETDRLAEETTIATTYATEGIEATHSIRAKNFDDLTTTGATGITRDNGDWKFSGTSDTLGKYTRVIEVAEANRDGGGNIDETGGNSDSDTRKITVTVTWNVAPTRGNSIILATYLTRWK